MRRDSRYGRDRRRSVWQTLGSLEVSGVSFANPVLTASGTAGHGAELAPYMPLQSLGAVVVKSLYHSEWKGNPPPRVHTAPLGMLNAVGLQGPGVDHWLRHDLPDLRATGATVVASIWGRCVEDYAIAASMLRGVEGIAALEVNLSCPNLEGRGGIFAHDESLSREVIAATTQVGLPVWAKLSANTDRVVDISRAVHEAGASAVTLINTLLGMQVNVQSRRAVLGNGGGGLSGPAIHPVAVRTIFDVRKELPELPIVGVGGVASGQDVIEMMMVGASLVQVGTATFARPDAAYRIMLEAARLARHLGATTWTELVDQAHRIQ